MLPKARPVPKAELDPDNEEPKSEVEPKAEVVAPPKGEDAELAPNAEPVGTPNSEAVEEVEPKGLDEDVVNGELKSEVDVEPNPDEAKLGGLITKGLEGAVEEKGFAADW